jgi:hypothetical protein
VDLQVDNVSEKHTASIFIADFGSENEESLFLQNVIYLQVHTALQPRRPASTFHRRGNLKSHRQDIY